MEQQKWKQNDTTPSKTPLLPYGVEVINGQVCIPKNMQPIWQVTDKGERYRSQISIYKLDDQLWAIDIDCEGRGKFAISPSSITIDWQTGGTGASHYFQTLAISLWLELQAVPCIHANAVVIQDKCVALIAPSGMGKSTLSAFLQTQGAQWLTDDMLALHRHDYLQKKALKPAQQHAQQYVVYPSWPKARMWPDSVQQVTQTSAGALSKVHERFSKVEVNLPIIEAHKGFALSAIYVLSRNGAELASLQQNPRLMRGHSGANSAYLTEAKSNTGISKVNSGMALMALLQNSMLGSAYSSLHLEQARLIQLSGVVNALPIKQIHYASSYTSLEHVYELILKDLNGT